MDAKSDPRFAARSRRKETPVRPGLRRLRTTSARRRRGASPGAIAALGSAARTCVRPSPQTLLSLPSGWLAARLAGYNTNSSAMCVVSFRVISYSRQLRGYAFSTRRLAWRSRVSSPAAVPSRQTLARWPPRRCSHRHHARPLVDLLLERRDRRSQPCVQDAAAVRSPRRRSTTAAQRRETSAPPAPRPSGSPPPAAGRHPASSPALTHRRCRRSAPPVGDDLLARQRPPPPDHVPPWSISSAPSM